ncbi:MAG TPA: hypothetical protein VMD74_03180 [Candidatus Methylomirabilis sp.]|nr:hypothetical protein [Candidatus Methylomirabilis sp.]
MAKKNKQKIEEFSEENKNLELVKVDESTNQNALLERVKDEAVELTGGKLDVRKGGNIVVGTMNVVVRPLTEHLKKRHEKFYRASKFHLLADIAFVLIILALAGIFLIIFNLQPKAQIDLQTSVSDASVISGQAETYTIQYANNGKVDINNSTLSLIFPKNFVLMTVSPETIWSDQTNTFKIGDLPRGANGQVKISGVAYGGIGDRQSLAYSLNYAQNGISGNTLGSYVYYLESSALETSFTAPATIYQNLDFGGTITLKNNGRADLNQEIDLAFANPPLVLKSISSPDAQLVNGAIIINGLKAGAVMKIDYEASSNAAAGAATAVLKTSLNLAGQKSEQSEVSRQLNITLPKFNVKITPDKDSVKSDEAINFKLNYISQENSALTGVTLTIMPADSATEVKNFSLSGGKYSASGNAVSLGDLPVGGSGEIDFSAALHRLADIINQQTGILVDINYQVNGRPTHYQMFSPKIKFVSDLQVSAKALYYSAAGDQLGVGPLPPAVDIPTKYWIFWQINNSGNELKNFTLSADLPSNVGWTNQTTVLAGDLRFGAASNKVIWTIDDVAATGGNYRVGFEVELIPTSAQIGLVPDLATGLQYIATDTFAGQNISGALPSPNADLKDDPAASGKGKVVQINVVR